MKTDIWFPITYPKSSIMDTNSNSDFRDKWILLNIGGKTFQTTLSTLKIREPSSMLSKMFDFQNDRLKSIQPSKMDINGAYLIDRDARYFEPILNYLRTGKLYFDKNMNIEGILEEAKFYQMESLIAIIHEIQQNESKNVLTREDVVSVLIRSASRQELRFQGVNLSNADLSKLDLSYINFKYAIMKNCNLQSANLTQCCLERADLSDSDLTSCSLAGVRAACASFQNATMTNCNFERDSIEPANLESANLKNANLENSLMSRVILRVANLKNASLNNCVLRGAVLAGADLENCDLSGSDLYEANLFYANLNNVNMSDIKTPIHMCQAIRF